MNLIHILFVICATFCQHSIAELESAHAIQIVTPANNHSFQLKLSELNQLLQVDSIKDRNVVVISIAGAFRQGKSFLLNFFIKFLNAQVTNSNSLKTITFIRTIFEIQNSSTTGTT